MTTKTQAETFADQLERVEHYRALGSERVVLPHGATDQPWELTTSVAPGGSHRLDLDTTLNFNYEHESGVTFVWFLDVEEREANGTGSYRIDVNKLAALFARLPAGPRETVREYLIASADTVEARGQEFIDIARRQFGDAAALRGLAWDV